MGSRFSSRAERRRSEVAEWRMLTMSHTLWSIVLPTVWPAVCTFEHPEDFLILLGEAFFPLRVLCIRKIIEKRGTAQLTNLLWHVVCMKAYNLALLTTRMKLVTPDYFLAWKIRRKLCKERNDAMIAWWDYTYPIACVANPLEKILDACFKDEVNVADWVWKYHLREHAWRLPIRVKYKDKNGVLQWIWRGGIDQETRCLQKRSESIASFVELLEENGHRDSARWLYQTLG